MAKREQPVANYLILTRECSKSLNKTSKNGAQNGKSAHRRAVLSRPEGEKNGLDMENCCGKLCGCGGVPCGGTAFCSPLEGKALPARYPGFPFEEKAFCCPAHTKSLKKRRAGCTIPLLYKAALGCLTADNFAAPYRGPAQGGKGRAAAGFCAPPRRKRRNQPWKNGPAIF